MDIETITDKFIKNINKFINKWYKEYYFKNDYPDFKKCSNKEKEYIVNIVEPLLKDPYITKKYDNLTIICAVIWYYYYINILEYYIIDDIDFTNQSLNNNKVIKKLIAELAISDEPTIKLTRRKIIFNEI
jgi:hypothetical protein